MSTFIIVFFTLCNNDFEIREFFPTCYTFFLIYFLKKSQKEYVDPLSANITKLSNTPKQFVSKLPTNCLSVFDHFVILVLKRLSVLCNKKYYYIEFRQHPNFLYLFFPKLSREEGSTTHRLCHTLAWLSWDYLTIHLVKC